jgi:hypothetical protein
MFKRIAALALCSFAILAIGSATKYRSNTIVLTYDKWESELQAAIADWIDTHPVYPDPLSSPTPTPAPTATPTPNPTPSLGSVTLAWDAPNQPPTVSGYNLYYGRSPGVWDKWTQTGNVLTYTQTGLTSGTKYYFMVRAYNPNGESVDSNQTSTIAP